MNVTKLSSTVISLSLGMAIATYAFTSQADNEPGHKWAPKQSSNSYWQAPDWSGLNTPPPARKQAPPPVNNTQNYKPAPRPAYNPYPNMQRNTPPQNMYRGPQQRGYPQQRAYPQAQPRTPYYGPNQGPSAFYTPGYRPNRNSGWNNNKFWGRSGPSRWMNPNKGNMEQGWDDMINAPSRMGEMPGGWTAPEVTVPNPIDMGDQVQENVEDLPDQMRNMDVGND